MERSRSLGSCRLRSQGCSILVRREKPCPRKQSRESGMGAEVRTDKQPDLSVSGSVILQCNIAAKGPHRGSGWMKR